MAVGRESPTGRGSKLLSRMGAQQGAEALCQASTLPASGLCGTQLDKSVAYSCRGQLLQAALTAYQQQDLRHAR